MRFKYYNKYGSDDPYNKSLYETHEVFEECTNRILAQLKDSSSRTANQETEKNKRKPEEEEQALVVTGIYCTPQAKKRKRNVSSPEESSSFTDMKERCGLCKLSGGFLNTLNIALVTRGEGRRAWAGHLTRIMCPGWAYLNVSSIF